MIGRANYDDRLDTKALVVGIVEESSQKAYDYRDLARASVVNDTFEGEALTIALNTKSGETSVFKSTAGDQQLSFQTSDDPIRMVDHQTDTIWNIGIGEAVSGKLKGTTLDRTLFIAAFWFSWADFYPNTEVYQA
ncbi:MAG: DUF3179 domain-containing (seleno)protein [SAR202 cluster bacterium]|nr:DUF3179 domain-containing (seleno)protein [SAR202 cluster bacterium]